MQSLTKSVLPKSTLPNQTAKKNYQAKTFVKLYKSRMIIVLYSIFAFTARIFDTIAMTSRSGTQKHAPP